MDTNELPKTGDDSKRANRYNNWDNYIKRNTKNTSIEDEFAKEKLMSLEDHISTSNEDMLNTRNVWDYVLSTIVEANKKIAADLAWNQKRIDLLKEITNKLCTNIDDLSMSFEEYIDLNNLNNNVKKLNLNFNKPSDD